MTKKKNGGMTGSCEDEVRRLVIHNRLKGGGKVFFFGLVASSQKFKLVLLTNCRGTEEAEIFVERTHRASATRKSANNRDSFVFSILHPWGTDCLNPCSHCYPGVSRLFSRVL